MANAIHDFLRQVRDVDDPGLLKELTSEALGSLGFNQFSYIGFNAPRTDKGYYVNTSFVQSTYKKEWVQYYVNNNLLYTDPIIQTAKSSLLPFSWDATEVAENETPPKKNFFREAERFGIHRGVVVPIHAPGGEFAIMAMVFDGTKNALRKVWASARYDLQLVGTYYHAAVFENILKRTVQPIPLLSPRELQTLQWAARGKTLWETAQIMGITEGTAKTHLKSLMRKLKTANKAHAVTKGLLHGLINV